MTSILFLVQTIQCKHFRWFYNKNKNFFSIFLCISQIYVKFWTFLNPNDLKSLNFCEVTYPEKRG